MTCCLQKFDHSRTDETRATDYERPHGRDGLLAPVAEVEAVDVQFSFGVLLADTYLDAPVRDGHHPSLPDCRIGAAFDDTEGMRGDWLIHGLGSYATPPSP